MSRTEIATTDAPTPKGAYSQGIVANGLLYTAGFGPLDPSTGEIVGTTIEEQTTQVMRNIAAVLAAHGRDFSDVVKATVHLADRSYFAGFNATYESFLTKPYPVRTTVSSGLPGFLVEIDVVALAG